MANHAERAYQLTFESTVELEEHFMFPKRTVIYTQFGRGEIGNDSITAKRLSRGKKKSGLFEFEALNDIHVYIYDFKQERTIHMGGRFTAYSSKGRKVK